MRKEKRETEEYERHVRETGGDYDVKKSRTWDNIAKALTLVIAFLIWLYVVTTNTDTQNATFDLIPIDLVGVEAMTEKGLAVQNMDFDRVNVTLKGTRQALSDVTAENISAYIDLSGITTPGDYPLIVKYNLPSGVAIDSPAETVQVTVDRLSSTVFTVDQSKIKLDSWTVAEDCYIDFGKSVVDINYVVVEAPTMVLSRVADVRVRSNNTVTLSTNSDVSAVVEVVDKNGNVITDPSITLKAYKGGAITESGSLSGGVYRSDVSVSISLVKEKTIPLIATDSDGLIPSEQITITPAEVVVVGSPAVVDSLSAVDLGTFSAKKLVETENGVAVLHFEKTDLPEGINTVSESNAQKILDNAVSATVEVRVGKTHELEVPNSYVTVVGGKAELVGDSVKLSLRSVADEAYYLLLEQRIQSGEGGISLVVNLNGLNVLTQTVAPITVIFSADFEGKVYEVLDEDAPYTVTVKPLES